MKPKQLLSILLFTAISLAACNAENPKSEEKQPAGEKDTVAMKSDTMAFDHLLVDNKKDPSCGMPVTAGIHDTAHYKNHVLGFCSKECKEEFKKNPEAMLASAEISKPSAK